MTNNKRLKKMMKRYKLTHKDVAAYTRYSMASVKAWCQAPGTAGFRKTPGHCLELMMLKLGWHWIPRGNPNGSLSQSIKERFKERGFQPPPAGSQMPRGPMVCVEVEGDDT